MTVASDLIKFQVILENTHAWAVREQRPRISTYIDLWTAKHPIRRGTQREPVLDPVMVIPESVNTSRAGANDVGYSGSELPSRPASRSRPPSPTRDICSGNHHEPLSEATQPISITRPSSKSKNIFKKRIFMAHPRGGRIPVKLPDVRGRDPTPNSTQPIQMAPSVFSTIRTTPNEVSTSDSHSLMDMQSHQGDHETPPPTERLGARRGKEKAKLDTRRGRAGPIAQQQVPLTPRFLRFADFSVDQSASRTRPAGGWQFNVPPSAQSMPQPSATPPRPRTFNVLEFDEGVFRDFAVPTVTTMRIPEFGSAMPFTPPASTDNTPLRQPLGATRGRLGLGGPSDGRDVFAHGERAGLPTPEFERDETTGRERNMPILETSAEKKAGWGEEDGRE